MNLLLLLFQHLFFLNLFFYPFKLLFFPIHLLLFFNFLQHPFILLLLFPKNLSIFPFLFGNLNLSFKGLHPFPPLALLFLFPLSFLPLHFPFGLGDTIVNFPLALIDNKTKPPLHGVQNIIHQISHLIPYKSISYWY